MAAGKRIKNEYLGGENEKGERKTEENSIKNGGKDLKNASLWVINSKNFLRPAHYNFIRRKKNLSQKCGGGMIEVQNINSWI